MKTKIKKYWVWFVLLVLLEVIIFSYLKLDFYKKAQISQKLHSEESAKFLCDIVKSELQESNYTHINYFLETWYKRHRHHLCLLTLIAENGYVIAHSENKNLELKDTFVIKKEIEYSYNKRAKLELYVDFTIVYAQVQEYLIGIFVAMLSSTAILAYVITLISKKNISSMNLKHRQEELDDLLQELVQEIERRKQTESELIGNQIQLQQAQEIALMGSWEFNYETSNIVGSPEFCNIVKLPYKDKGDIGLKELSKVTLKYSNILRGSIKSNEAVFFDEECYVVDQFTKKVTKTIRVIGKSVIDETTSTKVLRGVIQDISEKKNIENEIESANTDLKEMLHIVAHELQTPLVTMEGFSSLILDNFSEAIDEQLLYYLGRINSNSLNMKKLINSILDISRLNTIIYPLEKFSTIKMITDLKKEIGIMSKSKVFISINTFPEIPEIFGDKQRIYLVFRNLLLNAINYGGENLEIGYTPDKGFYVKDDGIGIKNNYIERIFIPGERLKETKAEGTGMGLTFCKKILELHHGRIWAESKGKGFGSTFYFNIPMGKGE